MSLHSCEAPTAREGPSNFTGRFLSHCQMYAKTEAAGRWTVRRNCAGQELRTAKLRTKNWELGTGNYEPEHEPGPWNPEPGTALFTSQRVHRLDAGGAAHGD